MSFESNRSFTIRSTLICVVGFVSLLFLAGCQQKDNSGVKATAHFMSAESFKNQGQFRSAVIEARNALIQNPDYADSAFLIADILILIGDGVGAERQLNILLERDPSNTGYQLLKAEAFIKQSKFKTAENYLGKIGVPATPQDQIEYFLLLGNSQLGSQQSENALNSYQKVLDLDEKNARALVNMAKVYFNDANNEQVDKHTERALATGRDVLELWLWQGKLALLAEDFKTAEESYSRALSHVQDFDILTTEKYFALNGMVKALNGQARPSAAQLFAKQLQNSHLGQLTESYRDAINSFQEGKFSDAEQVFKDILAKTPKHSASGTVLGMIKYGQGDLEEAEAYLEQALAGSSVPLQTHKLLAVTRLKLDKPEAALKIVENALVEHPEDDELLALRGAALLRLKDFTKAKRSFEESLKFNPLNQAALYSLATLEFDSNNYTAALPLYEKAAEQNANNLLALKGILDVKKAQNDLDAGITILKNLASANPDKGGPELLLTSASMQKRDIDGAIYHSERAYKLAPSDRTKSLVTQIYVEKAKTYAVKKQWPMSKKWALKARKFNPKSLGVTQHLIKLEMAQNRTEQALEQATWYQKEFPENNTIHEIKGDVLAISSRISEATESYKKAWENQKNSRLGLKLYRALSTLSEAKTATQPLRDWKNEDPKNPNARLSLAMALQESNQVKDAVKEYEELVNDFPKHPLVLNNLAWLYLENGNSKAVNLAQQAYELASSNPTIADTYGWILVKSNRVKEGLAILKTAAENSRNNKEIWNHYAEALALDGQKAEADRIREKHLN